MQRGRVVEEEQLGDARGHGHCRQHQPRPEKRNAIDECNDGGVAKTCRPKILRRRPPTARYSTYSSGHTASRHLQRLLSLPTQSTEWRCAALLSGRFSERKKKNFFFTFAGSRRSAWQTNVATGETQERNIEEKERGSSALEPSLVPRRATATGKPRRCRGPLAHACAECSSLTHTQGSPRTTLSYHINSLVLTLSFFFALLSLVFF